MLMRIIGFLSVLSCSLATVVKATEQLPIVQVEKLELTELSDEFTYPARVTSRVQGSVTADIDGVVVKVLAPLGQKVSRGAALFMIKNTDPVYEYVPVKVLSPVNGVVSLIEVSEGTNVRKGQKLGSIVDPSQIIIDVEIPAVDLSFLHRGLKGQFSFGDQQKLDVTVDGVSPLVDPVTGTASAELKILKGQVPLGVIGRAVFKTNIRKSLQVVEQAILLRGGDTLIRVVEGTTAKWVPVKVAATRKGLTEISSGVSPGATVIVGTSRFIADGQAVTVQQGDVAKK